MEENLKGELPRKTTLYCSFCGMSQHEVRKLIAGPTVFICDGCVELCNEILEKEGPHLFGPRLNHILDATSAFAVEWNGRVWMTALHAYQAAKFTDEAIIQNIFEAKSAHDARRIADEHKTEIRDDWDSVQVMLVEEISEAKLNQHPVIQDHLRRTGTCEIIEMSSDEFWGSGPPNCDGIRRGLNNHGKIWMRLRSQLPPVSE